MIRVRDDDVLLHSSSYENELGRLQQIHEWICEVPERLIHVPTILVTEIQEFPKCVDWVREETAAGRMLPEIHGLEHKDYAALSSIEIMSDLTYCKEWIQREFNHIPTKFYTPWGAGFDTRGAHIRPAAAEIGLELVTCEHINKLAGRYGVVRHLMDGGDINVYDGDEIFMHWWEGGSRLKRIVEVVKHGSWKAAQDHNRKLFQ